MEVQGPSGARRKGPAARASVPRPPGLHVTAAQASPCMAAGDLGDPVCRVTPSPSSTPAGPALAPARVPGMGRQALLPEGLVARSRRKGARGIRGGGVTISGDTMCCEQNRRNRSRFPSEWLKLEQEGAGDKNTAERVRSGPQRVLSAVPTARLAQDGPGLLLPGRE